MEPYHPNLDSVPYREFVVEPPPGFIPTPPITSYVPIEQSYHRLTKGDTNNFFEWTARHEAPMVMDSEKSRPWRKGDHPIQKDVVMWIDCKGELHNQVIISLQSQVATLTETVSSLTGTVSSLTTDCSVITSQASTITSQAAQITTLTETVSSLTGTVSSLIASITAMKSTLSTALRITL